MVSDLPGGDTTAHNRPEFSVSELSAALKRTVEDAFGYVRVRGEISRPTVAGSGHCYLRLKDENAVLDGVIWRGTMNKIAHRPEEGMEVIVSGRLTTYAGRSSYQIVIDSLELAGEGALLKLLEDRRKKLAAEGLFAEERKRALPHLPRVIGVVTSPTGAVIRDIIHRIEDRFPRHILVWPVRVQGEGAAEEVAAAIAGFNALPEGGAIPRPDVLIVARGGGSLEDLWAFNEKVVVRAAAASEIPLISAVGHETDTTLIDYAADRRAPTPTAAAEMAVPVRLDLVAGVEDRAARLTQSLRRLFEERRTQLDGLRRGLPNLAQVVEQKQQDLDGLSERLTAGPERLLVAKKQDLGVVAAGLQPMHLQRDVARYGEVLADRVGRLGEAILRLAGRADERVQGLVARLESVSPKRVLERGYALVRDGDGVPVTTAAGAMPGTAWQVEFHDGAVDVAVGPGVRSPKPKRQSSAGKDTGRQGSLL